MVEIANMSQWKCNDSWRWQWWPSAQIEPFQVSNLTKYAIFYSFVIVLKISFFFEHFKELVIKKSKQKNLHLFWPQWIGGAPSICLLRLCHGAALSVNKGLRDLFIIQSRSHNTRARLKSVMMFFGNGKCSLLILNNWGNVTVWLSAHCQTFQENSSSESSPERLSLSPQRHHKPLLATPNYLRDLSSCLK